MSCKTAAPCETLPAQTTLGDFDQTHKVVGLVRVVLKLCVPVESEVAVFTLEEVGLPEMLVQGNPGVDSFSASVAVEWSRRRFSGFDRFFLASCKSPTLLMYQKSMSEEISLSWEPKFTLLAGNDILTTIRAIVNDHGFHERNIRIIHCDDFWYHGCVSTTEI